jgi:hypothetical protein
MKGASGGLGGGLKSDKDDRDEDSTQAHRDQQQANFDRTATDREKNSESLRKLYGQRGSAIETNAATRAANPPGTSKAWNKPAHERFKDAERLILDKEKQLDRRLDSAFGKKRDEQKGINEKELSEYKARTYKKYGLDENGDELPNASPSPGKGTMRGGGSYQDPHIPTSQEDFDKIPEGGFFVNPADGEILRKKPKKTSALMDGGNEDMA